MSKRLKILDKRPYKVKQSVDISKGKDVLVLTHLHVRDGRIIRIKEYKR